MGKANLVWLGITLLMLAWTACGALGAGGGNKYFYIVPEASISHRPKLYEPFTLTGKATARQQDLSDAELWLTVTGAVYLEGEDRWQGPLKLGETKTIKATFAFVTAGEQDVAASVHADPAGVLVQPGLRSFPINIDVSGTTSSRSPDFGPAGRAYSWRPGDPHVVTGGNLILADTALLLNHTSTPRIEIIDSEEDLFRLQSEGMIPQELRYEWRFINPGKVVDFSKKFLIAYYDAQRPVPGHLILMENRGRFVWYEGTLKGGLKTYALPMEETRGSTLVSSVSVYGFGRADTPGGLPNTMAFQGPRTFEFTMDNGDSMQKTENLQEFISGNSP